ncbi:MAG: isoprenylcysteine carboxylmethyltransferase family protein [Candidatus Eisenbacteria sp.]|nr:isoprenylcysteine carboxylmethyltransferase family protein [Candidatus Eisenbacteria bacterium]
MNPWFAKTGILLGSTAIVVIRVMYRLRCRNVVVVKNRMGRLEVALMAFASIGFVVPLLWVASSVFEIADYSLHPVPFISGILCLVLGLLLFVWSHMALGTNWSVTLKVQEGHELVTRGIYCCVRHPMYLALMLYSVGQALVVPNWVAGPSCGIAMTILFALRMGVEERMMLEHFGKDYEEYVTRTKRLVPGIW